jgi:isopentenyldiphosphate isomerase
MLKDECILVDKDDQLVGHDNKYNCHQFSAETPHGILHRAFSVFLFDSENRLLLQQVLLLATRAHTHTHTHTPSRAHTHSLTHLVVYTRIHTHRFKHTQIHPQLMGE